LQLGQEAHLAGQQACRKARLSQQAKAGKRVAAVARLRRQAEEANKATGAEAASQQAAAKSRGQKGEAKRATAEVSWRREADGGFTAAAAEAANRHTAEVLRAEEQACDEAQFPAGLEACGDVKQQEELGGIIRSLVKKIEESVASDDWWTWRSLQALVAGFEADLRHGLCTERFVRLFPHSHALLRSTDF